MKKEEQNKQQNATNKFLTRMQNNSIQVKDKKPEMVLKQMRNNSPSIRQKQNTTITLA